MEMLLERLLLLRCAGAKLFYARLVFLDFALCVAKKSTRFLPVRLETRLKLLNFCAESLEALNL